MHRCRCYITSVESIGYVLEEAIEDILEEAIENVLEETIGNVLEEAIVKLWLAMQSSVVSSMSV